VVCLCLFALPHFRTRTVTLESKTTEGATKRQDPPPASLSAAECIALSEQSQLFACFGESSSGKEPSHRLHSSLHGAANRNPPFVASHSIFQRRSEQQTFLPASCSSKRNLPSGRCYETPSDDHQHPLPRIAVAYVQNLERCHTTHEGNPFPCPPWASSCLGTARDRHHTAHRPPRQTSPTATQNSNHQRRK